MRRLLTAVLGLLVVVLGSTAATPADAQVVVIPNGNGGITSLSFDPTAVQRGQTAPRDAQPAKPGTAVLRGRVMAADLGQPLRKAQVRLVSSGPSAPGQPPDNRLTNTDASGRYEFTAVRAGRYNITASKAGG